MSGAAQTRTVIYERWYLDEIERRERKEGPRPPARRPSIDKREADPRIALRRIVREKRESLAALSRMLDRPDRYLDTFVRDGRPTALTSSEHERLAAYFGVDPRALGIRDLWSRSA